MSSLEQTEKSPLISSEQIQITNTILYTKAKELKKSLRALNVFLYIVNTISGSGVYTSPGLVARYTNNMGTSLILCTIAGVVCLLGALCFANWQFH